jgi:hypothetical protein
MEMEKYNISTSELKELINKALISALTERTCTDAFHESKGDHLDQLKDAPKGIPSLFPLHFSPYERRPVHAGLLHRHQ